MVREADFVHPHVDLAQGTPTNRLLPLGFLKRGGSRHTHLFVGAGLRT